MQISFYVLGERYMNYNADSADTAPVANAEAVLNFVCRLTQTVLNKSDNSLVIVDNQQERLAKLDSALWTFDATSFIPHNLISYDLKLEATVIDDSIENSMLSAPVTLLTKQPKGFDGVVLNLAKNPLPLFGDVTLPERVLEIITPEESSKEEGREKYRVYRDLGFELIYFPIN